MDDMEQFYSSQYPSLGHNHFPAPAAADESGMDIIAPDTDTAPVNGSHHTNNGHTLDEMVSQNNKEQQRRRSMQPLYIQSQGTELTQATLVDYPGNDTAGFQFDPAQSCGVLAENVTEIMGPLQRDVDVHKQRPSRGSLALDTHFSNLPLAYESMSSANSYHSSLGPGSSVGFDPSASYIAPAMGSRMDFSHTGLAHPSVGVPQPMNVYQNPDYLSAPPHLTGNEAFSTLGTNTEDLGSIKAQARATPEIPIKKEEQLTAEILGQDLHAHVVPNGCEITMQNNPLSFVNSHPSHSTTQPCPPHSSVSLSSATSTVATASQNEKIVLGNVTAPRYSLSELKKVKHELLDKHSTTGLDAVDILTRVTTRPSPQIDIAEVDISCAFVVCDLNASNDPIVYVSDNFERLTGYSKREVLGRNCRFLQAPDGNVDAGTERKFVDGQAAFLLKSKIETRSEVQVSLINYRKGGQPFMNLLTMIPIRWDSEDYRFCVGFQVDLVEKPHAVSKRNSDGSYMVNYQRDKLPRYVLHTPEKRKTPSEIPQSASHTDSFASLDTAVTCELTKRSWEKMLLERSNDVVHVLSPKGQFLYLSPATTKVLEYEVDELVGTALSSICHPGDIVSLTRELRESTSNSSVCFIYRIRKKYSGYIWFETHGSLHTDSGQGKKCLILTGRERPAYDLAWSNILKAGGISGTELWAKMSLSGIFLFVSSNARELLDRLPQDLVGRSIQEYMRADSTAELQRALESTRMGRQVTFKHDLRHKRGQALQAETTLYPADAKEGLKPTFVMAQTRLLKLTRALSSPLRKTPVSPDVLSGTATPTPLTNPFSGSKNHQVGPSPCLTLPPPLNPRPFGFAEQVDLDGSIFEELKSTRGTSWQSELSQLRKENQNLGTEIDNLANRRKKRKRKKGTGSLEKRCGFCDTQNTPEWRRGPSGNRDLCNGCGLRWAKQNGRISPRKNQDQGDNISSASPHKPSPAGTPVVNVPQDKILVSKG